ncbi:putative DNA binding domain-containing protein, partial [Pseudomonadota bacterium]|nr:putative DNA binding domain-containing protein [Pseudomonadota bacterium]
KLEEDLNIIKENEPWNNLLSKIIEQRGRIEIQSSDLEGQGADSRFFNPYCIMLAQNNAKDWFNGIPINQNTNSFSLHKHHIFPVALLKRNGFSSDNKIQNDLVNEISNLAIITDNTNLKISDTEPHLYLPKIADRYPDSIANHYIPKNQELWKVVNFRDFLINRRILIAGAMNKFLNSYKQEDTSFINNDNIEKLVQMDESETLEFKETWQYDIRQSESKQVPTKNLQMQLNCIKTVAAFLNSNGGNLFIGIDDENVIEGLERDLELLKNKTLDQLENEISQVLINSLGSDKKPYYSLTQVKIKDAFIFRVKVEKCISNKTWVNFSGEQSFYIRDANSTRRLTPEEADNYWLERENT